MPYGKELIADVSGCNVRTFTREAIEEFMVAVTAEIGAERADLHFWDYHGAPEEYAAAQPHMKGTSAVQFISLSTIVVHTLEDLESVYVNVFSCGGFDDLAVAGLCESHFAGKAACRTLTRG